MDRPVTSGWPPGALTGTPRSPLRRWRSASVAAERALQRVHRCWWSWRWLRPQQIAWSCRCRCGAPAGWSRSPRQPPQHCMLRVTSARRAAVQPPGSSVVLPRV